MAISQLLRSSKAAIDLASIMVGIIVIGLIGAVIAATVFAVIPWTQDNAAKASLRSIATAQNAFSGLSSDGTLAGSLTASSTPTFRGGQNFTSVERLVELELLSENDTLGTTVGEHCYIAASASATGKIFYNSSEDLTIREATSNEDADVSWCGEFPTIPSLADNGGGSGGGTEPAPDGGDGSYEYDFVHVSLQAVNYAGKGETPAEMNIGCWVDNGVKDCTTSVMKYDEDASPESFDQTSSILRSYESKIKASASNALDKCGFKQDDCVNVLLDRDIKNSFPVKSDEWTVQISSLSYSY